MGKESRARVLADHQAMAIGRNIRVSPRKLNLVAQQIRGKKVDRALNELTFSPKRIARDVKKVLQSAVANAENNHDLDVDDLVVREASVGKNLVMKRFHARARGNSGGIEKFFSQITIVVEEKREAEKKQAKPEAKAEAKADAKPAKKSSAKAPAKKARGQEGASKGESVMGQKVNPTGLRLGINRTWDSRWYAGKKEYGKLLQEDIKIREYLSDKLKAAGVSRIVIERPHKKCRVTIHSARPGVVIGKKGADIEKLKSDVQKFTADEVHLNIVEIRKPEIDSKLVAENIAQQLERRVAFRRVMKRAVQTAMRLGALGIRITCGGRLGGAEIARVEWYREGRVPLHTLRADIDYGVATAFTTYGTCGVKVWIFKGEIMEHDPFATERRQAEAAEGNRPPRSAIARPPPRSKEKNHAVTQAHKIPQAAQGPHPRSGQGGHLAELRRLWPQGAGAGTAERARDRSRAPRHHPSYEARRPRLDPHLPGRAGVQEARRSPHGLGQGRAGILGGQGQAGPHPVRDRRRRSGNRQGSDAPGPGQAFHRTPNSSPAAS